MQVHELAAPIALRPSRLNYAGWCIYCGERYCAKANCVETHAESIWGPCSVCGGSQLFDIETDHLCDICIGGLTMYDTMEEAIEQERREMEARNRTQARHLSLVLEPGKGAALRVVTA